MFTLIITILHIISKEFTIKRISALQRNIAYDPGFYSQRAYFRGVKEITNTQPLLWIREGKRPLRKPFKGEWSTLLKQLVFTSSPSLYTLQQGSAITFNRGANFVPSLAHLMAGVVLASIVPVIMFLVGQK